MFEWSNILEENRENNLRDLMEFLSIPSVSTATEHQQDVRRAAEWVKQRLIKAGIPDVQIMETGGHPVVYGERVEEGNKPTLLFYGHFDVQPPEPLELWEHPPFEPIIKEGRLYARGASDMKANLLLPIIASEALIKANGRLPFNVKFLFEGEEEIGSPSLGEFVKENGDLLKCDLVISADGGIGSPEKPMINISHRGLAGLQIKVQSADVDLHSGMGGYAPNALHGLVSILNALRDEEGMIKVDHYYDGLEPISNEDRKRFHEKETEIERHMKEAGIKESFGESDFTPVERMYARPTLEINGMWGGFQGSGVKTVIPHEAFAKITCRLVAGQDPNIVKEQLKAFIHKVAPSYLKVVIEELPGSAFPYRLPQDHIGVKTLKEVIENTSEGSVTYGYSGGTVPIMGMLKQTLGVETITVGASEAGQNTHAPNEWVRLENFDRLQKIYCQYLTKLAESL